jgi:hypothetical protein
MRQREGSRERMALAEFLEDSLPLPSFLRGAGIYAVVLCFAMSGLFVDRLSARCVGITRF